MINNPIIIVAAARSGTKIFRSALNASNEVVAFPYDINYIWKYGNYHIPHDELKVENITPQIKKYIRKGFRKLLDKSNAKFVLEKTVSNSLRVDFVKEVFPDCKIVHLYRDGRDVTVSARECWKASLFSKKIQPPHLLIKKAFQFPFISARSYLLDYTSSYIKRFIKKEKKVNSWGPRFKGIDDFSKSNSLIKVCAMQWAKCVDHCLTSFSRLEENKDYINVRYEDFVREPELHLEYIADFIGIKDFSPLRNYAQKKITDNFVGYWKHKLTSEETDTIRPFIDKYLKILGYN